MKLKLTWLLTLFMAFGLQFSFAQEKAVTGTVTTAGDGLPLPGANVIIKGTSTGAQTDFDGNFSIKAKQGDILVISYVGMKSKNVTVGAQTEYNVSLDLDNSLDEVVVVGYQGATNSASVTSSIATVSNESIEQVPINSIDQMLQGNAAGVSVNTGSGQPGQSATILIRGRGSLQGGTEPLFIMDGVPIDGDNFRSLNQNDIESMSVLKDAAATAIYGNRGAGGVIIITTKQGKRGSGVRVQYRNLYGVSVNPNPQFQVMNTTQLLTWQRDLLPGTQRGDGLTDADIALLSNRANTDWGEIFFREGVNTSHELNISTGNENSSSYTSLNYFQQEGTTLGSELTRFSARNNFNGSTTDGKFNYNTSLTVNYSRSSFVVDAARDSNTGGQLDNPFIVPYIGLPYFSPFNPDGSLNITGTVESGALNPDGTRNLDNIAGFLNTPYLALNTATVNTDTENELKAVGSVSANYNFAKNLTVGASFGLDYTNIERLFIDTPNSIRGLSLPTAAAENKGRQFESFSRQASFITNAFLRYENELTDKLSMSASIYGEYNYTNNQSASFNAFGLNPALPGSGSGFIAGDTVEGIDDNGDGILAFGPEVSLPYIPSVGSSESEIALASTFATLDLDWDNKYGINAVVRRDATSRFVNNQSGIFWSLGARWNIDNEAFMEDVDFINILKLRASYGIVGNQDVGSRYIGRQTVNSGGGYLNTQGYSVGALRDLDIQWESSAKLNLGLSFGLFNSRITGEFDYYNEETSELFEDDLRSVAGTGFGTVRTNVGTMVNKGVDLQLTFDVLRKSKTNPWSVRINANGNYNNNEVTELPGGFTGTTLRIAEGRQAFTWFLPRWAGVDPANGQPLYLDVDGNITNVYTPDNSVYLDKNFDANFTGGFGADISYKGFSLNSLFSFQGERWRRNSSLAIVEDAGLASFSNMSTSMLDSWTTPGQVTGMPSLALGGLRAVQGDRYLENASFLRLRNATLAYNFDSELLGKTKLFSAARVFVQGTNLVTWTRWRGFDPEGNGTSGFFDYPVARTFSAGIDLTF